MKKFIFWICVVFLVYLGLQVAERRGGVLEMLSSLRSGTFQTTYGHRLRNTAEDVLSPLSNQHADLNGELGMLFSEGKRRYESGSLSLSQATCAARTIHLLRVANMERLMHQNEYQAIQTRELPELTRKPIKSESKPINIESSSTNLGIQEQMDVLSILAKLSGDSQKVDAGENSESVMISTLSKLTSEDKKEFSLTARRRLWTEYVGWMRPVIDQYLREIP